MNVRYFRIWVSASLCLSLFTDLLGYSNVYETNFFVYAKQKRFLHLFCSRGKSQVSLKQTPWGNFIWASKCCAFGPLHFAASQMILFKTCKAKPASLLQAKWLVLLLRAARGGEVQRNPSSWHACKRGSITSSAMLGKTLSNVCWPLTLWLWSMDHEGSTGC